MRVVLQNFDDCPNWRMVDDRLRLAMKQLDGFRGSPSLLVDVLLR
jgi:hypothetical protein